MKRLLLISLSLVLGLSVQATDKAISQLTVAGAISAGDIFVVETNYPTAPSTRTATVTTVFQSAPAIALTNGLASTNFALVTATNVAAVLTNQLVIPTTNQFVAASITNGLATTNYVNTATNGFVTATVTNGLATTNYVNTATNGHVTASITNGLATTNYVNTATNGHIMLLQATNVAAALTNQLVIPTTNTLATTNWVVTYADTNGAGVAAALIATNGLGGSGISATTATNIVVFILTNSPSIPADSVTNCGQSSVSISTNCLSWTGNGPNGKADGQGCATNVSVALDSGAGSHAGYFLIHNTGTPTTLQTTNWGTLTFGVIYSNKPTVCSYPGWATNAGTYLTAWWPKDVTTSNCLICASPSAVLPAANDSGRYAYLIVP